MLAKRTVFLAAALLAVVIGGLLLMGRPRAPEPDHGYDKIRLGMTLETVEAGLPPDIYKNQPPPDVAPLLLAEDGVPMKPRQYGSVAWFPLPYGVVVVLGDNDQIVGKALYTYEEPNWFKRVLRWVGL